MGLNSSKYLVDPDRHRDESLKDPLKDDLVNHPSHYTNGDIECIDAIKSALTPEEFRGYCKGSTLAYVWRERHKGGDQDIHKANWFLNRLVQEGKSVER